jgi:hypothetical protein
MRLSPSRSHHLTARAVLLSVSVLLLGACAETTIDRTSWIQVGKTTKPEVIAQFGEPDLVLTEPDGETVIYRPAQRVSPSVQVPTAQAGPLGTSRTQMETVEPGFGTRDTTSRRPQKEIRIHYNAQGIVQEVLQ